MDLHVKMSDQKREDQDCSQPTLKLQMLIVIMYYKLLKETLHDMATACVSTTAHVSWSLVLLSQIHSK